MTARESAPAPRLAFLDGLRGAALILMVVNHTARWWIDTRMTVGRYALIYVTLTLAAPTFLFLVGFCLALGRAQVTGVRESLVELSRRLVPRGGRIVLAGLVLNLGVFSGESILAGGVLQTIGLAVIAMVPAIWLLRFRWAPAVLLSVAIAGYVAFVMNYPALTRFVDRHPLIGLMLFYDFPPWPWVSLVLLGLVLGSSWLWIARQNPEATTRWVGAAAIVGGLMVLAFFTYDRWVGTPMRFGMRRDFILNYHWTPKPVALLWVLGMTLLMLAAFYWVMERRRVRLAWLVLLGQTALPLYFLHQVIAFTLVKNWLGWRFNAWSRFWLANAVFIALLVACAWAWRAVRGPITRKLWPRPRRPADLGEQAGNEPGEPLPAQHRAPVPDALDP
jgi:uncharacterized membrane protein